MTTPNSNAELQARADLTDIAIDKIYDALNNMVSVTTLNAAVLALQVQIDNINTQVVTNTNNITTLNNAVIATP
jgi:hypothetical protein